MTVDELFSKKYPGVFIYRELQFNPVDVVPSIEDVFDEETYKKNCTEDVTFWGVCMDALIKTITSVTGVAYTRRELVLPPEKDMMVWCIFPANVYSEESSWMEEALQYLEEIEQEAHLRSKKRLEAFLNSPEGEEYVQSLVRLFESKSSVKIHIPDE